MSLTFEILPNRGLVFVRYEGTVLIDETARSFQDYANHPLQAPGQKQLIDLSFVTGYERDFPRILELQMKKAEVFESGLPQTFMVYYAPTDTSMGLAQLISRSWDGLPGVVARIVNTSEADALMLLGQPETTFDDMVSNARNTAQHHG